MSMIKRKRIMKLSKDEKLIVDISVRPFIIFCLSVIIIAIIGTIFNTLSDDTINGYACCLILNMVITYGNLLYFMQCRTQDIENDNKEEG